MKDNKHRPIQLKRRGSELTWRWTTSFLILALIIFTFTSTISYHLGKTMPQTNWGGFLGRIMAEWLSKVFGYSIYLIIIALTLWAVYRLSQHRRWFWFVAIILWEAAFFFIISFDTYIAGITNWAGYLGNWFSRPFLTGLGLVAYLVPILLAIWGLSRLRRAKIKPYINYSIIIISGTILLSLILAYFLTNFMIRQNSSQFYFAGWLGKGITINLINIIGRFGTILILISLAIVYLLVFTNARTWLTRIKIPSLIKGIFKKRIRIEKFIPEPQIPVKGEPPGPITQEIEPVMAKRALAEYHFPKDEFRQQFLELLETPLEKETTINIDDARQGAELLLEKLAEFGIEGTISNILTGPMITRFEFQPAPGIKIQRIENLADDLALSLQAERIRILAPIPGKSAVGIEIPNKERRMVHLKKILVSTAFQNENSPLGFALGETITGEPYATDLQQMPHILIAGTTGSGKSVCINCIIASIIYRSSYQDVRFLTIDPKQLELPIYNPIPHLLSTTTIDPKTALAELDQVIMIMEQRYGEFARVGARDIIGYNEKMEKESKLKKPYIVVIIDELADLMLRAPIQIEDKITRLAQMSRAVGIHLILATQRPSVDVITGLIKANFPCRIAFQVASKTDSRTILDMNGAESLLGRGDMLFLPPGKGEPIRLHGAFISAAETKKIVDLWSEYYLTEMLDNFISDGRIKAREIIQQGALEILLDKEKASIKEKRQQLYSLLSDNVADSLLALDYHRALPEIEQADRKKLQTKETLREVDEFFEEAAKLVFRHKEASVSMLQRRLDVGWARAGRIIDQLEQAGIVGPYVGSKSRRVLVETEEELMKLIAEAKKYA
ncbi:MAG: DNA translocase FtsK 4TM domain-containing protein [candidate division WOR-3 bacterium]|nr:DNA translocase FtsK 4TM domain-containing protein [candidate division WOR-3 bacterium]